MFLSVFGQPREWRFENKRSINLKGLKESQQIDFGNRCIMEI